MKTTTVNAYSDASSAAAKRAELESKCLSVEAETAAKEEELQQLRVWFERKEVQWDQQLRIEADLRNAAAKTEATLSNVSSRLSSTEAEMSSLLSALRGKYAYKRFQCITIILIIY